MWEFAHREGDLELPHTGVPAPDVNTDPLEPPSLRTAAFVVAVERVARVALDRGIWP